MLKQTRIALALAAVFAVAGTGTALAGDKKHDDGQGSMGPAPSGAQHEGSKSPEQHPGQAAHPADTPGQAGTTPGQSGTTPGQSGNTPGQQRQQQSRPSDMDGPTADDATAGTDSMGGSDDASASDGTASASDKMSGDDSSASSSTESNR
jgi:hypothetical protein